MRTNAQQIARLVERLKSLSGADVGLARLIDELAPYLPAPDPTHPTAGAPARQGEGCSGLPLQPPRDLSGDIAPMPCAVVVA